MAPSSRPLPPRPTLNWFSPLLPARTDIAHYTQRILPALQAQADVTLWATTADTPDISTPSCAMETLDQAWPQVNFADFSVYQLGNSPHHHGAVFDVINRHPGVAVLHDLNFHESLRQHWLTKTPPEISQYRQALAYEAGQEALDALPLPGAQRAVDERAYAHRYPLTQALIRHVYGLVTHNPTVVSALRALTRAPIACLPLPYPASREAPQREARAFTPEAPLRMVIFGYLHSPNRRLREVLEAWATFPQRETLQLHVAGEVGDRATWSALAQKQGLAGQITWHGFVSEADLAALLDQADLALNLRYPSMGEASGALLRIWEHALPALVTRTAYYATLPEETVGFVESETEETDLHRHWAAMLADPSPYLEKGQAGRAHLESAHAPDAYVEGLLDFLRGPVTDYRGKAFAGPFTERVARYQIAPLTDAPARDYLAQRVATEVAGWVQS